MDKLEVVCEQCGKHTDHEHSYMVSGKVYCWECASNELKMEVKE